jgi:hypothetical protein
VGGAISMVDGSTEAEYNDVVRTVKDRNLTTGTGTTGKNYNMRVVPVVVIKRNNVTNNKNVEGTGTPGLVNK